MKTNTNQNGNKYIYKQIQIQRQIFSRPVLLWLRSHSVVGPRDNPGPVSAALDLPDPLYVTWGKISGIWKFHIYKSTIFFEIHGVQWLIIMSRDQILLYNLEMGINIAFVTYHMIWSVVKPQDGVDNWTRWGKTQVYIKGRQAIEEAAPAEKVKVILRRKRRMAWKWMP